MFQNLINIITAPQVAFASLREKRSALFPLLLIIIFAGLTQFLFFSNIDPEFLIDQLVEQSISQGENSGQEAEMRENLGKIPPIVFGIGSIAGAVIFIPVFFSIFAGYLAFMSKFGGDDIGFKHWFSLVCWTSIVTVFATLASIVAIINSGGNIPMDQISVLSLNNLIFQNTGPFKAVLGAINITQIWSLILLIMGYKAWTERSTLASTLTVSIPYILFYGIWSLFIIF